MNISHIPVVNQICSLNNDRITLANFRTLYSGIDYTKPTFLCLTNYNDVAPLFMWLGLELVDTVYNHNSGVINHLYMGMLNKDRVEQIIEDGGTTEGYLSYPYMQQHHPSPSSRFVVYI